MRISAPVELIPPQRECLQHLWSVQSSGKAVEEEVYTCLYCGAQWRRTVRYRGHDRQGGVLPLPEWPTWEDIIDEPL